MRFDDRLLTVLNQPAGDRHDIAVRWRQLVDLVARAGANAGSPLVAQALESIRADAPQVDQMLRAAAAKAVAALPLPLGLLEHFASEGLAVSAPVLAAATLEPAQWRAIMAGADEETRRFIETLQPEIRARQTQDVAGSLVHDAEQEVHADEPLDLTELAVKMLQPERAPEQAPAAEEPHVERAAEEPPRLPPTPSLHEVVERIERRRRSRSLLKRGAGGLATEGPPTLFRWECGPGGEIAWVDGAPRGAAIGRSIARSQDDDRVDRKVVRAFALRLPFRDGVLTIGGDGLLSGEWKISGVPAFEPADGRFAGYRGVAVREQAEAPAVEQPAGLLSDPDSVRELVHEIKTPLNAIIGFAEIIDGQYLGPANQTYRERAREIVREAGLLVTAIDDLDFAAKVQSAPAGADRRTDLSGLVERMAAELRDAAASEGVEIDGPYASGATDAAIAPDLAERLILRMCAAAIGLAQAGERLRLTVERAGRRAHVSLTRPAKLVGVSAEQLLGGELDFDDGFSLRLVQGLARLVGADLVAPQGSIALALPRA